jgi:hypothetical protein
VRGYFTRTQNKEPKSFYKDTKQKAQIFLQGHKIKSRNPFMRNKKSIPMPLARTQNKEPKSFDKDAKQRA